MPFTHFQLTFGRHRRRAGSDGGRDPATAPREDIASLGCTTMGGPPVLALRTSAYDGAPPKTTSQKVDLMAPRIACWGDTFLGILSRRSFHLVTIQKNV
ncbi:hypothetical protein HHI36_021779 [Cryptolaemus montrouzieri]|uniref:Uncharacterized protein n=1 Tax=Cryptolaemus montrouzieri TaxID=559131 RepID=A0ABD2MXX2_9CUCU